MGTTNVTPETVKEWTDRLAAVTQHRSLAHEEAQLVDARWRENIKLASRAGLTAPQISAVVGVSSYRVYQIVAGRRT